MGSPAHFIPRRMTTTGAETVVNIFCISVRNEYSISAEGQTLGSLWIVQCWHLGLVYCSIVKVWVYKVLYLTEQVNIKNFKFILLDSANVSKSWVVILASDCEFSTFHRDGFHCDRHPATHQVCNTFHYVCMDDVCMPYSKAG